MSNSLKITIIIIVLVAIGAGGWFLVTKQLQKNISINQINLELNGDVQNIRELKIKDIDTSNWKTYRNEEFGFEIKYPEGWQISTDKIGELQESQLSITHCPTVDNTEYCGGINVYIVGNSDKKQNILKTYSQWAWTFKKQIDTMPIEGAFNQNIALTGGQKCYVNPVSIKLQINEPIKECLMVGGGEEYPHGLLKPSLGSNYFFKHGQNIYLLEISTEYHFKSIKHNFKGYSLVLGPEYGNNLEMTKMILQSFQFIKN